jgi:hypothetical protein
MFRFDDAMRGWGYRPIYDLAADRLYREAQKKNDPDYRGIAMRDEACLFRRLLGFAAHELLHAFNGDLTKANYGLPFGLPYGVPVELPIGEEARYLDPFNRAEARAWLGPSLIADFLWGLEFDVHTARDVGTYGFAGGNALVAVPSGFRPVPHWDRVLHPGPYYELARALEAEERGWFTEHRLVELGEWFAEAEAEGGRHRSKPWPGAMELARRKPRLPGRNDACLCGSGKKYKKCCAHLFAH